MKKPPVEEFARHLQPSVTDAVRSASIKKIASRTQVLASIFEDVEAARSIASELKDDVLENLQDYLAEFIEKAEQNGFQIHLAANASEANQQIAEICSQALQLGDSRLIAKAKSMATEEIELNHALEEAGFEPIETDLGEYVVQIDHDHPSHIVTPIIHKTLKDVADSFFRNGLGSYSDSPEELTMQARKKLRGVFKSAKIGISGVNFGIVETGKIVLVENEGNNRFCTTAPDVHIAVMGIEKLLKSEGNLPLFLRLLAGSATGQALTTYTHFISGPRKSDEQDGPRESHLVILDNGRRRVLNGKYRSVLKCIRCGACLNVCPVYRQASGHAYGNVYPGPIGAVLAPALHGIEKFGHLAFASSLCGACEEVCPVKIPLPKMLIEIRNDQMSQRHGVDVTWESFAFGSVHPSFWKFGLKMLPLTGGLAGFHFLPAGWMEFHSLPKRVGRDFRGWFESANLAPSASTTEEKNNTEIENPVMANDVGNASLDDFLTRFRALGGIALGSEEKVEGVQSYCADDDVPMEWMEKHLDPGLKRVNEWDADLGITMAETGILETGSVLILNKPNRRRLNSLAPPSHLIFLSTAKIVSRIEDAVAMLDNRTAVIITGPSRTADIEGILIRGIHGPGKLFLCLVD